MHVVLAELCHQLEQEPKADVGENDHMDIFHRLVSSLNSSNSVYEIVGNRADSESPGVYWTHKFDKTYIDSGAQVSVMWRD